MVRAGSAESKILESSSLPYRVVILSLDIDRQWIFAGGLVGPALDSGEEPFDSGAVTANLELLRVNRAWTSTWSPLAVFILNYRHEVFCAGQNENIRLSASQYCGKPLSVFAGDGGKGETPSEPKRSVAAPDS